METPILDFLRRYDAAHMARFHMPGHKGRGPLGCEHLDITEIKGADALYEADGIIAQSEANASALFGCRTFYSTEGSSQCIRAMLYLVLRYATLQGRKPLIAAGRNAHKTFLTAAALLDFQVRWLYPRTGAGYLCCEPDARELEAYLQSTPEPPAAVYLTSPDYLGNIADVAALAAVCRRHGVLLVVDNAHGAYLKFLPESRHPMDLGADLCCDSAHKTLPALTGGAYLHLSREMEQSLGHRVRDGLMLFGSTSPSYLILQSLDAVNAYLEDYPRRLAAFARRVRALRGRLEAHGFRLCGSEPLKLTFDAAAYGYTGLALAQYLRQKGMEPEFADRDHLVLMLTPENGMDALARLERVLCALEPREPIREPAPACPRGVQRMSIREALLSQSETLPVERCLGRILAIPTVACPPAVPILVCGEEITAQAIDCFTYYGITECCVIKEQEATWN